MAAGDLVQIGTSIVVGFNSRVIGTCIMSDVTEEPGADAKEIRGHQNELKTVILTNPHRKITASGVMLAADFATLAAAKIGDTITLNSIKYRLTSAPIVLGNQEAKVTISATKEDSMTYT